MVHFSQQYVKTVHQRSVKLAPCCWQRGIGSGAGRSSADIRVFEFKFQISIRMQAQLTEFFLQLTLRKAQPLAQLPNSSFLNRSWEGKTSAQLLQHIHQTLNSEQNYRPAFGHKISLSSEDTSPQSPAKCNCKKSKCLKMYCECFARGSFCKGCNCDCCQNTQEHSETRAKAIDEMMMKSSLPFGYKTASVRGCNCKKTGCQKKYCDCFNQGVSCTEHCKCANCANCSN